jgi:hypothetical protein
MNTDLKRLGRRNAYRLGRLRAQGIGEPAAPAPFRVTFTRPRHRGPVMLWLLAWLAGTAAIALGAAAGLWFLPFVVGLVTGLANRLGQWRLRVLLPVTAVMAAAGWGVALTWPVLHGQPYGATARVIAALAGLPALAVTGFAAALLVAAVQAVIGGWLGSVATARLRDD